ncbi:LytTR family DNA-binding domain-containing protein [Niabella sp. CC-SYL272]|uniref:LytR/AlgR family response regulator transcription factor n=1 Tax=Niabella agricola TaxID=2891571 RepID=UPI001F273833|nr:LytTR family DNA-binding domain-containing protein [Niabella agricola]MCF3110553.1 LytTR family DNA-binding domain-containing protein [Niabella agricola]
MTQTKMIRCVILDDEPLAVTLLKNYIEQTEGLAVMACGTKWQPLISYLEEGLADLVFMDIRMPEKTGMELMARFNRQNCFVITSAYPQYAVESYQYQVIDYLLKPISYDRFVKSIVKFRQWKALPQSVPVLYIKESGVQHPVREDEIVYIEGLRDYIRIYTVRRSFMVLTNLKDILQRLSQQQFMRIHRSYIVNLHKLEKIQAGSVVVGQKELPVGDTYRKAFLMRIQEAGGA